MQALMRSRMEYESTECSDENPSSEFYMDDAIDHLGLLDMGYSLELSLTGDYEDL